MEAVMLVERIEVGVGMVLELALELGLGSEPGQASERGSDRASAPWQWLGSRSW